MTQLDLCQRWRSRRSSYVVPDTRIDPRLFEVAAIDHEAALAFVLEHHYSGRYSSARARFGLFRRDALVGVAVFSVGGGPEVLSILPCDAAVELGRFVLLDGVEANGETYFLARCFVRRGGFGGVVSFSDDIPRTTLAGDIVFKGHLGIIYQAHNALYTGRGAVRTKYLLPDGQEFSARAAQKIRARERGWRGAAKPLVAAGAPPLGELDDSRAWLRIWLPRVARPLRHPGCHRYIWPLDRATRLALPDHLRERRVEVSPYPKVMFKPTDPRRRAARRVCPKETAA